MPAKATSTIGGWGRTDAGLRFRCGQGVQGGGKKGAHIKKNEKAKGAVLYTVS
jgi:hypothetical protein